MKLKINKRKIQYASLSTVFIALFIALVVLFNIFVGTMTDRYSLQLDLTQNQEFSISEGTELMLDQVDEKVKIYIMERELYFEAPNAANLADGLVDKRVNAIDQIEEIVKRYVTASGGNIEYEFIDRNQNPRFYDKYPEAKATNGRASALVIVSNEREGEDFRYATILASEIISFNENKSVMYSTESELSGAILYVLSDEVSKAGLITGHNELGDPTLVKSILDANFIDQVQINLLESNIPEDVNNLFIIAPQYDYTGAEIAKIDAFLKTPGNNVYVFWNSSLNTNLPVLERFLNDWGLIISPSTIVLDQEHNTDSILRCTVPANDVTANLMQDDEVLYTFFAHPIKFGETNGYTRVLSLAQTEKTSYERQLDANINIYEDRRQGESIGPFDISAVSEQVKLDSKGVPLSNCVFLFGTEFMAIEEITALPVSLNANFLNEIIGYANKNTNTLRIAPKLVAQYELNIYESQLDDLWWVFYVFMPLGILAVGLLIFTLRIRKDSRRKK